MMKEFFEAFGIVLALLLVLLLIVFVFMTGAAYLDCKGFARTGYETEYHWGCYVKVGDNWVPKQYVYGTANEVRITNKK